MNNRTAILPAIKMESGKEYTEVKDRVIHIANNYVYSITTKEKYYPDIKMWKVKAVVEITEDGVVSKYTGTATEYENKQQGHVNSTSALENAETSAVGRALGFAGIGINHGIATADEMRGPKMQQGQEGKEPAKKEPVKSDIAPDNLKNFDNTTFLINMIEGAETLERIKGLEDQFNKQPEKYNETGMKAIKQAFVKRKATIKKRGQRAAKNQ